ncbi:MAG: hypothetical protein DMF80_03220 [Acidobacteria bacterium]|nr:MAG: hypothetical protein DMF80_03220 [Acidobacteriota bacterium]
MRTPASIKGHPIHAMLVGLPVGLLIFSFVSDLLLVGGLGGADWAVVARCNLAAGIVTALLAAVPGLLDYLSLAGRARRVATWHLLLNLAVIGVFVMDFLLRLRTDPYDKVPVFFSAVGIALLAVSGWLGGEMVYRLGVGVDPRPEP